MKIEKSSGKSEHIKFIDLSKQIKSEKKERTFEKIALIIALASLIVTILPVQIIISDIIFSFQKPEHSIDIIEGKEFEYPNTIIEKDRFIQIEQKIDSKIKSEKAIFSHKIKNNGQNEIKKYYTKIYIIDPIGRKRGELLIQEDEMKFKTIFKFPSEEEKLFGEWNIYSQVIFEGKVYSIIKTPFEVKQKEPWFINFLINFIIAITITGVMIYIKLIRDYR